MVRPASHDFVGDGFTHDGPRAETDRCAGDGGLSEVINATRIYGGGDVGNGGLAKTEPIAAHGFDQSVRLTIPPLGCLLLKKI